MVNKVMTTDENKPLLLNETKNQTLNNNLNKPSICSIITIVLTVLIGDASRGILFPTLWLLIESLGGQKLHQGIAVASFSAGRIISSPILGHYSEIYGYKYILILSNLIIIVGCLVYMSASNIWMIFLAQWIIGFGAGTLGVTRAYVVEYAHKQNRTVYIAYLTAVQYGGFTLTPALGACLSSLAFSQSNSNKDDHSSTQRHSLISSILNPYSIPVLFLILLSIVGIIFCIVGFEETTNEYRNLINVNI